MQSTEHSASQLIRMSLPLRKEDLAGLSIGDQVLLSGRMYTLRDAGHKRLMSELEEKGELPYGLSGQTIFYAGPTPARDGQPFGAIGPTTASRMDFATPALLDAGIVATIGKGKRSHEVREACKRNGCVYFAAVGGIAALLAQRVESSELIAYEDLGTEALRLIDVVDFPVFVEVSADGRSLYESIEENFES